MSCFKCTQWPKLLLFFKVRYNISIKISCTAQLTALSCAGVASPGSEDFGGHPTFSFLENPPQTSTNCLFSLFQSVFWKLSILRCAHEWVSEPGCFGAWPLWKQSTTFSFPLALLPVEGTDWHTWIREERCRRC